MPQVPLGAALERAHQHPPSRCFPGRAPSLTPQGTSKKGPFLGDLPTSCQKHACWDPVSREVKVPWLGDIKFPWVTKGSEVLARRWTGSLVSSLWGRLLLKARDLEG